MENYEEGLQDVANVNKGLQVHIDTLEQKLKALRDDHTKTETDYNNLRRKMNDLELEFDNENNLEVDELIQSQKNQYQVVNNERSNGGGFKNKMASSDSGNFLSETSRGKFKDQQSKSSQYEYQANKSKYFFDNCYKIFDFYHHFLNFYAEIKNVYLMCFLVEIKMEQIKKEYAEQQDQLYLLIKYILANKKQFVRVSGICKFLCILKRNGVMYTYEILPKVWKYDDYKFILKYTSLIFEEEYLNNQIGKNINKKTTVKNTRPETQQSVKQRLFPFRNSLLAPPPNNNFELAEQRNKARSTFNFMIHSKIKHIPKVEEDNKNHLKKLPLVEELERNQKEIIEVVFAFFQSRKVDEKQILMFTREMKVPFKLDLLIGFHTARVNFLKLIFLTVYLASL